MTSIFDTYHYKGKWQSYPILITECWARGWSRCRGSHLTRDFLSNPWQYHAITFHQACDHLPSRRLLPSFDQYQVVLLGDKGTLVNNLPKVVMQLCPGGNWTHNLLFAFPTSTAMPPTAPSPCTYKLCVIMHLLHTDSSLSYLSGLMTATVNIPPRKRLRSANINCYKPLTTRLNWCFSHTRLKAGNVLPTKLQDLTNQSVFTCQLKTFLFDSLAAGHLSVSDAETASVSCILRGSHNSSDRQDVKCTTQGHRKTNDQRTPTDRYWHF